MAYLDPNIGSDTYVDELPGLEGSVQFHADINGDTVVDMKDVAALNQLIGYDCCDPINYIPFFRCTGDVDHDTDIDFDDLNLLLAAYGSIEGDPNYPGYDLDVDLDFDSDVDFDDMNILLANYGKECDCYGFTTGGGAAPLGGGTPGVSLTGVSTPAAAGPAGTLICDLSVTGTNGGWTLAGLDAATVGDTRFVVSSDPNDTPATVAAGQCYVRTPSTITSAPTLTAGPIIAGTYDPGAPDATFGSQALNIAWCPVSPTADGAILHLALTLSSGVSASTPYISTTGPHDEGDTRLVDLTIAIGTLDNETPTTVTGGLYVSGE